MRRVYVTPEQFDAGGALSAEQQRYLSSVLRLPAGTVVELFDGRGARRTATLRDGQLVDLGPAQTPNGAARCDVVLAQALAKADKLELVIQKATELGVSRVVPFAAERSVVKLEADRGAAKAERWRKIAQEAARQCGRADVPLVDEPVRWDALFALLAAEPGRRGLLLDTGPQAVRLGEAARGVASVLVAIGPEGGFSDAERTRALEGGFLPVSLGSLVLRTETAGLAALAVIQHVNGALG